MIEAHCLGPEVDPAKISPDARVSGGSYITGALTQIAAGAIVHDSRVHNGTVGEGARLEDSIFIQEGEPQSGKCDAAGRVVIRGADKPYLDKGARASGCTLVNCAIGQRTRILDTWAENCRIAEQNDIRLAKLSMVNSGRAVTISGPTEVSGASLGHHATIDQRGYFEGLFSNRFLQLRCDETTGALNVVGQIELPHVSRYGFNTVNSTNSGKLRPQLDGIVRGLGPHVGPWQDAMLNHEHVHLGPCCWVAPWTKVIGQSADAHETDDAMVNDALMSYVMPFAIAGHQGGLTQALVMPGELSIGYGPKKRQGAWAFTYAPDAVIRMVRRLWDALEPDRRHVADAIVDEALHTALAITRSMAAQRKIDLDVPSAGQRRGWPQWVARTCERLRVHLDAALWRFGDGQPLEWTEQDGRWTHPRIDRLLAVAPDALEDQVAEEALFAVPDPVPKIKMALPTGATGPRPGPPEIHGDATVAADAFIGPGCRIGAGQNLGQRRRRGPHRPRRPHRSLHRSAQHRRQREQAAILETDRLDTRRWINRRQRRSAPIGHCAPRPHRGLRRSGRGRRPLPNNPRRDRAAGRHEQPSHALPHVRVVRAPALGADDGVP
jgi:hypothetical protein